MVYKIIVNYVYTGATVGRTMKIAAPLSRKRVMQDKKDWIIVEGMHEAIVSKEEFEAAQKVIHKGKTTHVRKTGDYPLKGLVRCGNCKRAMRRRIWRDIAYFTCINSMQDSDTECAKGIRYYEKDLKRLILNAIWQMTELANKQEIQEKSFADKQKSAADCEKNLKNLQAQAEQLKGSKLRWYEKYTGGDISKAEYLKLKSDVDKKLSENETAQWEAESRMEQLDSERTCSDDRMDAACRDFQKSRQITCELAHAFIKAIYVYPDNRVEIEWKFKEPFVK